jgi:hypothetical protein
MLHILNTAVQDAVRGDTKPTQMGQSFTSGFLFRVTYLSFVVFKLSHATRTARVTFTLTSYTACATLVAFPPPLRRTLIRAKA